MSTGSGWVRLGQYVTSRRVALGYATQRALAEKTGLTERVIGKAETGRSVSRSTMAALELALRWAPGSAQSVIDGGEATPLPDPEGSRDPQIVRDNWDDKFVRDVWDLPAEVSRAQKLSLIEAHLAELRRGRRQEQGGTAV